jgi:hypothetical protein
MHVSFLFKKIRNLSNFDNVSKIDMTNTTWYLYDSLNMSDHYREIKKSDKKKLRRSCFTLASHKYFVSILVLLINYNLKK